MNPDSIVSFHLNVTGLVQSVGFRPYIFRLAQQFSLYGKVSNNAGSVEIIIQGSSGAVKNFISELKNHPPQPARIENITITECPVSDIQSFIIEESSPDGSGITVVSPDIAVCGLCMEDIKNQKHRLDYPLVNCMHCGPRFSIIKSLPYDRKNTTMAEFTMCEKCRREYENPLDRRYHAQPAACNTCGPFLYNLLKTPENCKNIEILIKQMADVLQKSGIILLKGTGGFQFLANALDENAVQRLRRIKKRDQKPFAVMFLNIEQASEFVIIDKYTAGLLLSPERPIVLCQLKKNPAAGICSGLDTMGIILPYMPVHHLLLSRLAFPVIFTSGNLSDEPIVIKDDSAKKLAEFCESAVSYNREIHNRTDDSVLFTDGQKRYFIRRSRGYAPLPCNIRYRAEGIFAAGAELKNTFALGRENQVIMSQHIGDLKNPDVYNFYRESAERFFSLFRFTPRAAACDLHPDYFSTRFVASLGVPVYSVQHHHAHIAACMTENNLDEKIIGIAFDGTGLGEDGNIWGGEFFFSQLENSERASWLSPLPLPGGDLAVKEPWRTALSCLYAIDKNIETFSFLPLFKNISEEKIHIIREALKHNINTPLSSAAGRLFDAASALVGLVYCAGYEAEAPMKLEAIIDKNENGVYHVPEEKIIDTRYLINGLLEDIKNRCAIPVIAARFHNTMAVLICRTAGRMRNISGLKKVALSGGVFQNRFLLKKTKTLLQ
ncbi:MAG: carbamoyltransferase HypF, partial [Spirochaetes bacterium GWF1_41_5]